MRRGLSLSKKFTLCVSRRLLERGAVSIQVYGLNRLHLVQARTKLMQDLEFSLSGVATA